MRIDHVWHQMFKQTAKCSGQPRLKRLVEVTKFLLLISLSNSYCESVFNTPRKIGIDGRHNLHEILHKVMQLLVYT